MSTVIAPRLSDQRLTLGVQTQLKLNENCEDWKVKADMLPDIADEPPMRGDTATLRRIGWLDQRGRVWTDVPSGHGFDGGSLTPLLIDVRD